LHPVIYYDLRYTCYFILYLWVIIKINVLQRHEKDNLVILMTEIAKSKHCLWLLVESCDRLILEATYNQCLIHNNTEDKKEIVEMVLRILRIICVYLNKCWFFLIHVLVAVEKYHSWQWLSPRLEGNNISVMFGKQKMKIKWDM